MAKILWRGLLILCLGLAGAWLGAWSGATYFVAKNSGLAGGAMVLGYVALGFVGFAITGAVIGLRLHGQKLRNTALVIGVPVLTFYLILTVMAFIKAAAEREPDSAFAPAGEFTVTMERLDTSDPYLFVRMHVDSKSRTWTQTGPAPEHKVCSAKINSKNLIEIREALDQLLVISADKLADCDTENLRPVKQLRWNLMDGRSEPPDRSVLPKQGSLNVNTTCQHKHFEIARVFLLVEKISLQPGGTVSCE